MNRRSFISNAMCAAASGFMAGRARAIVAPGTLGPEHQTNSYGVHPESLNQHRFGVNYTPSRNWWFCWNDWDADPIRRDLDAITSLGADHLRILLIWPYFQPNPTWVSPVHMNRLVQLLTMMEERSLDAVMTVFTGQLSGWFFLPPFNKPESAFYADQTIWAAQELLIRQLAAVMAHHKNVIGFDIGNEINTCWSTKPETGDAWMARMFALMRTVLSHGLNVNGVDEMPWFESDTFSPQALAAVSMPTMHCYPYWSGALKYGGPMDPPSTRLLAAMASLIRSYAGDPRKPVWAEEFNTCIESLTESQQAQWLEKAVSEAIASGVSWFTYWDSHDVDRKFAFNSLEYNLGLLTNEGRIKEQGRVFRELAETYRGKDVVFPAQPLRPPPDKRTHEVTWQWMLNWMGWKPEAGL